VQAGDSLGTFWEGRFPEQHLPGVASWGELISESSLRIVTDCTPGSTFTLEDSGIRLVQLGDRRDGANLVEAAMVDSLRPYNLNLPTLSS
jgi:hypothetical protein